MNKDIGWLLEKDNLSVRYYTLKYILKMKDSEIIGEYENMLGDKTINSILSLQDKKGWWFTKKITFNPLYKNTFWQLYFLAQAGLAHRLKEIDVPVELVVKNMQKKDGSFCSVSRYSSVLPCIQGMASETLIRLGYGYEYFTAKVLNFIHKWVHMNSFRCKYRQNLNCPWGAAKILKSLNYLPQRLIDQNVLSTKKAAISYLLKYSIAKAAYPRKKNRSRHWFMFGYPRNYQSDILEVTSSLVDAGLNSKNDNIYSALNYIYSKHTAEGRWKMEFSLNGRMLVDIEEKGKPSKWITFLALKTLIKSGYLKQ